MATFIFNGTVGPLTATLVNPYSGDIIFVDGDYNQSLVSYFGTSDPDTLLFTVDNTILRIEDDLGNQVFGDIETIVASNGNDVIFLASTTYTLGNLQIFGASADDVIWSNAGDDIIQGNNGDDIIDGGPGHDNINGGADNDIILGGEGDDTLDGGDGDDILTGGAGMDTYLAGQGFDTIIEADDAEINVLRIPAPLTLADLTLDIVGDDLVVTLGALGAVTIHNQFVGTGSGIDTLIFSDSSTYDLRSISQGPTEGDDVLDGTPLDDVIDALGGNDIVNGLDGHDTLTGGLGDDVLNGGNGNDILNGDDGNDTLNGDAGSDTLNGGLGMDVLSGGDDDDMLNGGDGDDVLNGDAGSDILNGEGGDDDLFGGLGADMLHGGDGSDTLNGGDDNDTLSGDAGNDILNGDAGDDVLSGGTGTDTLHGGDGADILNGGDDNDVLNGGNGNDVLNGDAGDDLIDGGEGDDVMTGGSGSDTYVASAGNDTVVEADDAELNSIRIPSGLSLADLSFAFVGNDLVMTMGSLGVITISNQFVGTGSGIDTLIFADNSTFNLRTVTPPTPSEPTNGDDVLEGTAGDDEINALRGDDVVNGLAGNDTLYGAKGDDILNGDEGDDLLFGGKGEDTLNGGQGNDLLYGGRGNDILNGDEGDDLLFGDRGADLLNGGDGNDTLHYSSDARWGCWYGARNVGSVDEAGTNEFIRLRGYSRSFDEFNGGDGHDTLVLGRGNDALFLDDKFSPRPDGTEGPRISGIEVIDGGCGNDIIDLTSNRYDYGDVMLIGGEGNDVLWSSAGNDILVIGQGKDKAFGGAGSDTFVFDTFDRGVDTIQDFEAGVGGDILNITDILQGYDPLSDHLSDFIKLANRCGHTDLQLRADGDAHGRFLTIARFEGGLDSTLQEMIDNGNLVADHSVLV